MPQRLDRCSVKQSNNKADDFLKSEIMIKIDLNGCKLEILAFCTVPQVQFVIIFSRTWTLQETESGEKEFCFSFSEILANLPGLSHGLAVLTIIQ